MEILTEEQYPILGFVAACNRNYYNPTAEQVMLWRHSPAPREAVYRRVPVAERRPPFAPDTPAISQLSNWLEMDGLNPVREAMATLTRAMRTSHFSGIGGVSSTREQVEPAETVIDHLIRLMWLEETSSAATREPGLRLTELGRALLRDVEVEAEHEDGLGVVVLGREDPLAYPTLIGQLSGAGAGLLVDPYLKIDGLHRIVVSTQLTRLLVSGKSNNLGEVVAMQAYLDSPSIGRSVEVRSSTQLHDRVLVAEDERVATLGTSLNGVGRTTTVLSPLPPVAAQALRSEYESLWDSATIVGPPVVEATDDDAEDAHAETSD